MFDNFFLDFFFFFPIGGRQKNQLTIPWKIGNISPIFAVSVGRGPHAKAPKKTETTAFLPLQPFPSYCFQTVPLVWFDYRLLSSARQAETACILTVCTLFLITVHVRYSKSAQIQIQSDHIGMHCILSSTDRFGIQEYGYGKGT